MPIELTKVSYTTAASATGGRTGHVVSADGVVDLAATSGSPSTPPDFSHRSGGGA